MKECVSFGVALMLICALVAQFGDRVFVVVAMTWWLVPLGACLIGYRRDRGKKWLGRPEGFK